jgi:hypothetical protein
VQAVPTRPWTSEAARSVLPAMALPHSLVIVGFTVEQALGP